jgi:hypothetical protein
MKTSRIAATAFLLASLSFLLTAVGSTAPKPVLTAPIGPSHVSLINSYHGVVEEIATGPIDESGGIKEEVPTKYAARYQDWKREFLATEAGRNQWASYEHNPNFTLTIAVSRENAEGATTGRYKWNDSGQLIAATIMLGVRLDEGYPDPIYFPVMSSLVSTESINRIKGSTLAATKLAHEFGHVIRTAKADATAYQLQTLLIPQYNKIFFSNGRNENDPKLIELAAKIGGTPVQIWEDREYWGEANAMLYLRDRFTEDSMRCSIFSRIRHSVDLYAKSYEPRFIEVARATPNQRPCGWQ